MSLPLLRPGRRPVIFISSRIEEFRSERKHIAQMIRSKFQLEVFFFEEYARPYPPRSVYAPYVEQAQVFVGLYGSGYGWIDEAGGMDISGIHDEWQTAANRNIPRLVFVKNADTPREPRLEVLLDEISRSVSYASYESEEDLLGLIEKSLWEVIHNCLLDAVGGTSATPRDYSAELVEKYADTPVIETTFFQEDLLPLIERASRVFIHGAPGIGKTACLMLLIRHRGGIYLSLRNKPLLESLTHIAGRLSMVLGLKPPSLLSVDDAASVCTDLLTQAETLLVVDDVDQNEEVASFLYELPSGRSKLVFAGRAPGRSHPEDFIMLKCTGFTADEASRYVSEASPDSETRLQEKAIDLSCGNPLYLSYFSKRPSEEPADSLDSYHKRTWERLPATSQELIAVVSEARVSLALEDLTTVVGGYRGRTASPLEIKHEIDDLRSLLVVSHGSVSLFHPAFSEFVNGVLAGAGLRAGINKQLAALYGVQGRVDLAAYHLLVAGQEEEAYERLPEAEAQAYYSGNISIARSLLACDIVLSRRRRDLFRIGRALHYTADIRQRTIGVRSAMRTAILAEKMLRKADEEEWAKFTRALIATFQVELGQGSEAVSTLRKLAEHWRQQGLYHQEAIMRTNLGFVFARLGRLYDCKRESLRAKELHEASGDRLGYALSLLNLGNAYSGSEENEKLCEIARELLSLSKELGVPRLAAAGHNELTAYYRRTDDLDKAELAAKESIKIARALGDWHCLAMNAGNLGNVYRDKKDYSKAREQYLECGRIGARIGSTSHIAMSKSLLAGLADEEGDRDVAISLGKEVIELWENIPNAYRLGCDHREQADRHEGQKHWKEATQHCQDSGDAYMIAGLPAEAVLSYGHGVDLSVDHLDKGASAEALAYSISRMATPPGVCALPRLLDGLREWGGRLEGTLSPIRIIEATLPGISADTAKADLLELVRSVVIAVKSLGSGAAEALVTLTGALADKASSEGGDHLLAAVALVLEQIPPSIDGSSLSGLLQRLGEIDNAISFRSEQHLGDQWLVSINGPDVPTADIRSAKPGTHDERIVAATTAIILLRQRRALSEVVSSVGWKRIGWRIETFSEGAFRQHGLPIPTHFPNEMPVCITIPADRNDSSIESMPLLVSDTYIAQADLVENPENRCILALSLQVLGECVCHFTADGLSDDASRAARQRMMTDMFDVHLKADESLEQDC